MKTAGLKTIIRRTNCKLEKVLLALSEYKSHFAF